MPLALATPIFAARRSSVALSLGMALSLALPLVVARAVSTVCVDALGDEIAGRLSSVLAPLSSAVTPPLPDDTLTDAELAVQMPTVRALTTLAKNAHGAKRGAKPSVMHAIRISSAQVLSLAAQRAMPDAAPVRATADHPAGLQLRGVSALGVGLRDGDVLTEAAGQRASSVATVVGVVLAARARHSAEISGRFFRAGVPYVVVVEQPYPPGT